MSANRKVNRFLDQIADSWWWRRYSDLIDRKSNGRGFDYKAAIDFQTRWQRLRYGDQVKNGLVFNKREPVRVAKVGETTPPMLPRPENMTRQTHRRLFRQACKLAGAPYEPSYQTHGLMSKKAYRKAMKELAKYDNQTKPRSYLPPTYNFTVPGDQRP